MSSVMSRHSTIPHLHIGSCHLRRLPNAFVFATRSDTANSRTRCSLRPRADASSGHNSNKVAFPSHAKRQLLCLAAAGVTSLAAGES